MEIENDIDGVTYNCLHDEELEDLKTVIAYEERKKNKTFEPIDFDDFQKREKRNMGSNFKVKIDPYVIAKVDDIDYYYLKIWQF